MRVRAYLRRSHAEERGVSIDVQRQAIATDVARRAWLLDTVEYVDDDRSAFRDDIDNRPAMQQALADAKRRAFDVLAVYKWDRLARSEAIYHGLLADFKRLHVKVISATESDEPLARSLSGLLAAEYSRILSRRMTDVTRYDASLGKLVGPAPRGYNRGPDGIPIQNQDAPMVRELGELYATGDYSAARLAARFGLHTDAVSEMIVCPTYAGLIACGDDTYQGKHIPIWPADLWARIQSVREARSRRRGRVMGGSPGLLAGMLICAGCGAPLWAHNRGVFRCSTLATKQPGPVDGLVCRGGVTSGAAVEGVVIALLVGLARIPGLLEEVAQAISTTQPSVPARRRDDRVLDRLKLQFLREEISASEYDRRKREAEAIPAEPVSAIAPDPAIARLLLFNLSDLIRSATPAELRPVVHELITDVYARRRDVIAIRPTAMGSALFGSAAVREDEWLMQLEQSAGSPPGPPE